MIRLRGFSRLALVTSSRYIGMLQRAHIANVTPLSHGSVQLLLNGCTYQHATCHIRTACTFKSHCAVGERHGPIKWRSVPCFPIFAHIGRTKTTYLGLYKVGVSCKQIQEGRTNPILFSKIHQNLLSFARVQNETT